MCFAKGREGVTALRPPFSPCSFFFFRVYVICGPWSLVLFHIVSVCVVGYRTRFILYIALHNIFRHLLYILHCVCTVPLSAFHLLAVTLASFALKAPRLTRHSIHKSPSGLPILRYLLNLCCVNLSVVVVKSTYPFTSVGQTSRSQKE